MDFKWFGWTATAFVGMTLINGVLGGELFTSMDLEVLNQIGISQGIDIGFMSFPVPNTNVFSGLMRMLTFDYSFFGGNAQIILYFLYGVTLMISIFLVITLIGIAVNAFRIR